MNKIFAILSFCSMLLVQPAMADTSTTTQALSPEQAVNLTREKSALALQRYSQNDIEGATAAAISAHVDGFESLETSLSTINAELVEEVEGALNKLAADVVSNVSLSQVESDVSKINHELDEVVDLLSQTELSGTQAATASFIILLREGIEAVLVLAAIAGFLRKTDRPEAMKYVHGGWIIALALGGVSWYVATTLIEINGANREITEGITALVASAMLLYVGFWLHSSSNAARWSSYVKDKLQSADGSQRIWPFMMIAFFAVYREVFETVLFYQTLWLQLPVGERHFLLVGFAAAAGALVLLSWVVFRMSIKLPLKTFFTANAILLVVLAVVFAGKGVVGLQEAGIIPLQHVSFPKISLLGIYPDLQSLMAQAAVLLLVVAFIAYSKKSATRAANI